MSKALRVAIEDSPAMHIYARNVGAPHLMSNDNTPCFNEFMILMKCARKTETTNDVSHCRKAFVDFINCMQKRGFTTPLKKNE